MTGETAWKQELKLEWKPGMESQQRRVILMLVEMEERRILQRFV